jgi:hypothetical protein
MQAAANCRAAEVAGLDYVSGVRGQFSALFGLAAVFQASSLANSA